MESDATMASDRSPRPMGRDRDPFSWCALPESAAVGAGLGLVGVGKASVDLFLAFWVGRDELQRAELLAAATEAGVNLRTDLRGGEAWG